MLKYVNINSCLPITTVSQLYFCHGNIKAELSSWSLSVLTELIT